MVDGHERLWAGGGDELLLVTDPTRPGRAETTHVDLLLAHVDRLGLTPQPVTRGWDHMGAIICDAGLQARANYTRTVLPRVTDLVQLWPAATTTAAFIAQLATNDLGAALRWRGPKKLLLIENLAAVMNIEGVQTPADLAAAYADESAATAFATKLRQIRGVGPKTVNYLAILAGSKQYVAVDQHLRAFVHEAGVMSLTNEEVRHLYVVAATERGWTPGDLDAAVWAYRATRHR